MNWIDIIIIIYLIIAVISGVVQGLIRAVLSIVGLIVGIILAGKYYSQLGNTLAFIHNSNVANIVAFVIILLVVMAIAALIAFLFRSIIKAVMLGWIDRLGGAVFGLLLGILSVSAILAITVKLTNSSLITDSALASFLLDKFPLIMGFLPKEFDPIQNFFQ